MALRRGTDALIYVVDSADHERLAEAGKELERVLSDDLMRDAALLVYANKQDAKHAAPPAEVAKALSLDKERKRQWHVQGAAAITGDGLYEGMDWLSVALKTRAKQLAK